MDKSSITMMADSDWWLERVTMDGEQRYPERIRVGNLDAPRVYVPERTCRIVKVGELRSLGFDAVGYAPGCSRCGWRSGTWEYYDYCPHCGSKVDRKDAR